MRINSETRLATGLALAMLVGGYALTPAESGESLVLSAVRNNPVVEARAEVRSQDVLWEERVAALESAYLEMDFELEEAHTKLAEAQIETERATAERSHAQQHIENLNKSLEQTRAEIAHAVSQNASLQHQLHLSARLRPAGFFMHAYRDQQRSGMWTFAGAYNTIALKKFDLGVADSGHFVVYYNPGTVQPEAAERDVGLRVYEPTGRIIAESTQPVLADVAGHVVFPYTIPLRMHGHYRFAVTLDGEESGSLDLLIQKDE